MPLETKINNQAVVDEFGAFYIDQGQTLADISDFLLIPNKLEKEFEQELTNQTVIRGATMEVDSYIQPYKHEFEETTEIITNPLHRELFHVKHEVAFIPNEFSKSWAQFVLKVGGTADSHPFVPYVMENFIFKKKAENFAQFEVFKGVRQEPVANVVLPKGKAMNGQLKVLQNLTLAGLIAPIITGAFSTDPITFVTQIETFVFQIPEWLISAPDLLSSLQMSRALQLRFRQGNRLKYNDKHPVISEDRMDYVFETEVKVDFYHEKSGSNNICIYTKNNAVMAYNPYESDQMEMQIVDRKVKFMTDYYVGFGFRKPQNVWINELI